MQFALNEDQVAVRDMAREFAAEKIAPHALRWDEEKHFPVDVMRDRKPRHRRHLYQGRRRRLRHDPLRRRADLRGAGAGLPTCRPSSRSTTWRRG